MRNGTNWTATDELQRRIDAIGAAFSASRSPTQLARDLDSLRALVRANGNGVALRMIRVIDSALARGERGPAITGGLALLRDAAICGGGDARTGRLLSAAYAVRYRA
jgi:hypothetical protein